MVFAVGFRELVRRASPRYEWLGTLSFGALAVWVGVTLVANGLEGGAALDARSGHGDPSVARALTMGYLLIYNSLDRVRHDCALPGHSRLRDARDRDTAAL